MLNPNRPLNPQCIFRTATAWRKRKRWFWHQPVTFFIFYSPTKILSLSAEEKGAPRELGSVGVVCLHKHQLTQLCIFQAGWPNTHHSMGNSDITATQNYSLVRASHHSLLHPLCVFSVFNSHHVSRFFSFFFFLLSCLALVSILTPSLIMSEDEVWSCLSLAAYWFLEMQKCVPRTSTDINTEWRSGVVKKSVIKGLVRGRMSLHVKKKTVFEENQCAKQQNCW